MNLSSFQNEIWNEIELSALSTKRCEVFQHGPERTERVNKQVKDPSSGQSASASISSSAHLNALLRHQLHPASPRFTHAHTEKEQNSRTSFHAQLGRSHMTLSPLVTSPQRRNVGPDTRHVTRCDQLTSQASTGGFSTPHHLMLTTSSPWLRPLLCRAIERAEQKNVTNWSNACWRISS